MIVLSIEEFEPIISWDAHGVSFTIHDADRLSKEVLPKFFKGTKYSSFLRKLYRWGFAKRREMSGKKVRALSYSNPVSPFHADWSHTRILSQSIMTMMFSFNSSIDFFRDFEGEILIYAKQFYASVMKVTELILLGSYLIKMVLQLKILQMPKKRLLLWLLV